MLPCRDCAYQQSIPGSCHSRCVFDWSQHIDDIPQHQHPSPFTMQWFRFPFNFDPVWGPSACTAFSTERDPAKVAKPSPLADLLSILEDRP